MRSAKESEAFPYSSTLVCYFSVNMFGTVRQINHDFTSVAAAYKEAVNGTNKIYAVWPGNYRSDLFEIDDLNLFADAFGVPRPDTHKHIVNWKKSSIDDGKSRYAFVDIIFECGCKLYSDNIKIIAADLEEEKGWEVATSKGYGVRSNDKTMEYTLSVLRNTLS